MIEYKCGHKSKGLIVSDSFPTSIASYIRWAESVGINGTRTICYECWWKEREKQL